LQKPCKCRFYHITFVPPAGEESYVAVDKGAIVDGHVLVLPIEHFPNSLGVPPGAHAEMERYLSALQTCYAAQVREKHPLLLAIEDGV